MSKVSVCDKFLEYEYEKTHMKISNLCVQRLLGLNNLLPAETYSIHPCSNYHLTYLLISRWWHFFLSFWWAVYITSKFIEYTLLIPGWFPCFPQDCINSSWHSFNKMLENSSEILIHIYVQHIRWLYIHDANRLFSKIPKVLCWTEICWLWRFEYSERMTMFKKTVWDDLSVLSGFRWMFINGCTWSACRLWYLINVQLWFSEQKCAKKISLI